MQNENKVVLGDFNLKPNNPDMLDFVNNYDLTKVTVVTSYNQCLKVVSATFSLVCFLSLKKSTCETRKNIFYFTSKALFVLEKIKF